MSLSVVFFGHCPAVDIDFQTCIWPCPRELCMGDCCQTVTCTAPLAPLPFSKSKTLFPPHTDLQNAMFKDANSNFIYFEQRTPQFSLIILYLSIEFGDFTTEYQKRKSPGYSSPNRLVSAAKMVCFTKPTYLSRVHLIEAFCLW